MKYWEHGGETSIANGVLLCSRHHHFLHAHPTWQVVWDQITFRVYRDDQTEVCPTLEHTTLEHTTSTSNPPTWTSPARKPEAQVTGSGDGSEEDPVTLSTSGVKLPL